jgi:galactokinase
MPLGVLWRLLQEGIAVGGFSMGLGGDVPLGTGLRSSASELALRLSRLAGLVIGIERQTIMMIASAKLPIT